MKNLYRGIPGIEDAEDAKLCLGSNGHCSFEVVLVERDQITIRDLNIGKTVTNDAEHVVKQLRAVELLVPGRKLFYYDSANDLDEILWEGAEIGFRPGPGRKAT